MDNDNKLVQKAADVYRSLRFAMKYRGLTILSAEDGNNAIAAAVTAGAPYMAARCGATEMRTAADYLQNGGTGFAERTRQDIRNLSGVFPTDDATLAKFCRTYIECAHTADLLALWNVGAEREVVRGCGPATCYTKLRALEPYYHPHPWSAALAGSFSPARRFCPRLPTCASCRPCRAWPGPTPVTPAGLTHWLRWSRKWTLHRTMLPSLGPVPTACRWRPMPATRATSPSR